MSDELRTLLEKATPGPWTLCPDLNGCECGHGTQSIDARAGEVVIAEFRDLTDPLNESESNNTEPVETRRANAALIVAAVNALPALLADTPSVEPEDRDAELLRDARAVVKTAIGLAKSSDTLSEQDATIRWMQAVRDRIDAFLDRRVPAGCGCLCNCHDEQASPEWPGPCAACCEVEHNCKCGVELRRLGMRMSLARKSETGGTATPVLADTPSVEPGETTEPRVYCDECDGTGWVEGGPTIQTDCDKCDGTGWEDGQP